MKRRSAPLAQLPAAALQGVGEAALERAASPRIAPTMGAAEAARSSGG